MLCEAQPALIVIFKEILENRDLAGGLVKFLIKFGANGAPPGPIKKACTLPQNSLDGAELACSQARRAT